MIFGPDKANPFGPKVLPMSSEGNVTPVSGTDTEKGGGAGGIRTLDRPLQAYNGLANRRLQPLGHSSLIPADMPDTGLSRKVQIAGDRRRRSCPSRPVIWRCMPLRGEKVRAFCATLARNLDPEVCLWVACA